MMSTPDVYKIQLDTTGERLLVYNKDETIATQIFSVSDNDRKAVVEMTMLFGLSKPGKGYFFGYVDIDSKTIEPVAIIDEDRWPDW